MSGISKECAAGFEIKKSELKVATSRFRLSASLLPLALRGLDALMVVIGGLVALELRGFSEIGIQLPSDLRGYYSLILSGGILFLLLSGEANRSWRASTIAATLLRVGSIWLLTAGSLLVWLFISKASESYSRLWFIYWTLFGILFLWLERGMVQWLLRRFRKSALHLKSVILIGKGSSAELIQTRIREAEWTGYQILETFFDADEDTLEHLSRQPPDEIWLSFPLSENEKIHRILYGLRHCTAPIRLSPDWLTFRLINHGVSDVAGIPMIDLSASPLTGTSQLLKFLEDKLLALVILLLVSPVMLLIAVGVKISSPGPIFYRQTRIGLNNQPFQMLKFRSMPVDIEKEGPRWGNSGAKVKSPFGRFIRRTSLDELPQFINVLRGEMSIVGPRPERPEFVEQFKEEIPSYMRKHLVKAGITGWAQVNGWRGDTDLQARIEHDLYYIEHWSLLFDLRIIFLTIFRGFYHSESL
jgi:putative colanic acid biosynthesis UDP-glucose lipid carrier transferase